MFPKEPLEEKACDKPAGGIVEPDEFSQIPAGALIVPGTELAAVQPHTGEKLTDEDQAGVGESPKQQGTVFEQAADRSEQGGHTVDGKHPDGGDAGQLIVPPAESVKGCEGDFQKPPQQSTVDKVVQKVFHSHSMDSVKAVYTGIW